jgi:hypothetical protein
VPECQAVLEHTGEKCRREEGHTQYHRGDGGPFGPWVGPDRITPKKRRASIESLVAEGQRAARTSQVVRGTDE